MNVQRKSVGSHASRGGGECEGEVANWSDDEPESKQSRVQFETKGGGGGNEGRHRDVVRVWVHHRVHHCQGAWPGRMESGRVA